MSMNFKEAKEWAKQDPENRFWQDQWKYGNIVRGLGLGKEGIIFDWGDDATPTQKILLKECINNISKWASKVEEILDNPPTSAQRRLFKIMKRIKMVK